VHLYHISLIQGPLWSWSYSSWTYNYPCNQYLSQVMLWVRIHLMVGVLDTTLCDKVCQWFAAGLFIPGTPDSSTNKTDRHDIAEILLKLVLNTNQSIIIWGYPSPKTTFSLQKGWPYKRVITVIKLCLNTWVVS
jgi:hypothetical protein